jgi:hypothetical protein
MYELKLGKVSAKSALFGSSIFLVLTALKNGFENFYILYFVILFFILFIISFTMIITTILPLYELFGKSDKSYFFRICFPYYALFFFISCVGLAIQSNFDDFSLIVLTTAFFSAMFSWIWLFKNTAKNTETNET